MNIDKANCFTDVHSSLRNIRAAVIGVSGGADSMCLLDMLHRNTEICLTVVHVHHGIRGAEADRDADFVRRECVARGLRLFVVRADVPFIAATEKCGVEEAGRLVRYEIFRHIQQHVGADCIITAHTSSDRAETVLLNIIRGCGVSGLGGISSSYDGVLRPLLGCTREDVERYCTENNVPYITDSTNIDQTYTRNAVRHSVLPMLRAINPMVDDALLRLSDAAVADESALTTYAMAQREAARCDTGGYLRSALQPLPPAILYRVLRISLAEIGCRSMEYRHFLLFNEMLQIGNGCVQLPGGYCLQVTDKYVFIKAELQKRQPASLPARISVDHLPFSSRFGDFTVNISVEDAASIERFKKIHKMFFKYTLDYDRISAGLHLRHRDRGDYLHPAGRGVGKSLKVLMSEWRMAEDERMIYPLLCDEDGIVMVPGYCCDERVRAGDDTKHFLVCTVEKATL